MCFLTSTETRFFGLYAVGETLGINCNDIPGTATLLQWLDDSGNIVASITNYCSDITEVK